MVAVISVDAYPFLAFRDLTCHLYNRCFLVALCHLIVGRLNSEVATKRFLQTSSSDFIKITSRIGVS